MEVVIGLKSANVIWFLRRHFLSSSKEVAQENIQAVELSGLCSCKPETGLAVAFLSSFEEAFLGLTERSPTRLSLSLQSDGWTLRRLLQLVVKMARGGLPRNLFSKEDSMALAHPVADSHNARGLSLSKHWWVRKVTQSKNLPKRLSHHFWQSPVSLRPWQGILSSVTTGASFSSQWNARKLSKCFLAVEVLLLGPFVSLMSSRAALSSNSMMTVRVRSWWCSSIDGALSGGVRSGGVSCGRRIHLLTGEVNGTVHFFT